jgi:hypothetical protein
MSSFQSALAQLVQIANDFQTRSVALQSFLNLVVTYGGTPAQAQAFIDADSALQTLMQAALATTQTTVQGITAIAAVPAILTSTSPMSSNIAPTSPQTGN